MCSIRGKAGGSRVLTTAVPLPVRCGPGTAASPCQAAVPVLPPWINLCLWCVLRAAHCPSHRAPATQCANPFLSVPPTSPRVNGNRRWAAEMPVNKAQLLRGEGQRTKMRTSLCSARLLLLPPAPAQGWKLLLDSPFLLLKVSPFTQALFVFQWICQRLSSPPDQWLGVPWMQIVLFWVFLRWTHKGSC